MGLPARLLAPCAAVRRHALACAAMRWRAVVGRYMLLRLASLYTSVTGPERLSPCSVR